MAKGRRKQATKVETQPTIGEVNRFAAQHGTIVIAPLPVTAGEFPDEPAGNKQVRRRLTTIETWQANGALGPVQVRAIELYWRAWHASIGMPKVTANWSTTNTIRSTAGAERIEGKLDGLSLLKELDESVFRNMPEHYRGCWQNVVIHDETAGVAGSRLGYAKREGAVRAQLIVQLVADMIASQLRL